MLHKRWKPKTNIASFFVYFFLLSYVGAVIKDFFNGQFTAIDGWRLLNLIVFLIMTYWVQRSFGSTISIVIYASYMMVVGCLFAFVFSDVPVAWQTVTLYFIGAFFGSILWYVIAAKWLRS
ncbi:hypothetical protein [Enterococcus sp. DIV0876]|uniref:hypothetical protein n=1 Tax=Enterococcus sp. DIV0876 TaxID=2774633 RepID=UPI003D2FA541